MDDHEPTAEHSRGLRARRGDWSSRVAAPDVLRRLCCVDRRRDVCARLARTLASSLGYSWRILRFRLSDRPAAVEVRETRLNGPIRDRKRWIHIRIVA